MDNNKHSHRFIETYEGIGAFGLDRASDEETIAFLLQKFSDDTCLSALLPRLQESEIENLHNLIYTLLKRHFSEDEYHSIFLKDNHHHG
ncbi:cytoplasmic protein [Desulfobotulus sp. H1]|uniref:Cytoplasmic protein n=1 Tax=Desulfobotulus pelophilus TaxID=2823377 RepID=A0ABT3N8F1_9BACT|nr:cytoplasmic protein [Desulfobotulus pelophilus]MCW7753730.1 cytoplasmic protein [Desulfobotulus pelophilus]